MVAEGNTLIPLKNFTGYDDAAPDVWLEKFAIFANLLKDGMPSKL